MTDDELERMLRASLRHRAGDVTTGEGLASAARGMARRRQHLKVAVAGVAAVAVIAPVGVLAALNRDGAVSSTSIPTRGGTTTQASAGSGEVPASWRVESYDGVQLRVPADWGWGGVPVHDVGGSQALMTCGNGAFAHPGPSGETVFKEDVDMPYVGRAHYYMTDVCIGGLPPATQPYVWLGSPLEVRTEQLANGFTRETVEVGGVRVTVADDNRSELATIVGTIEAVQTDANGCDRVTNLDRAWDGLDRIDHVDSVSVCVYRLTDGARALLGYSTSIKRQQAEHLLEAVKATQGGIYDCQVPPSPSPDQVVLRFRGSDGTADIQAQLDDCGGYLTAEGVRRFTRTNVEPWIVDGVGLYVSGGWVGNSISPLLHPTPG